MTKATAEAPPLPNGSIDFQALNEAAKIGKAHDALAPGGSAMLVDEQAVTAAKEAAALAEAAAQEIADAAAAEKPAPASKPKPPADAA